MPSNLSESLKHSDKSWTATNVMMCGFAEYTDNGIISLDQFHSIECVFCRQHANKCRCLFTNMNKTSNLVKKRQYWHIVFQNRLLYRF